MKIALIALMCFVAVSVSGQASQSCMDYEIENIQLLGSFRYGVSLKTLFDPSNLVNFTAAEGKQVACRLDKKTVQGKSITYLFTTTVEKKPVLKTVLRFEVKESEEAVSMVYIKVTNPVSGQVSMAEDDGTQQTLGRVLGIFGGIAAFIVDVDKVNALAKTN
jgi:hypothetical protein